MKKIITESDSKYNHLEKMSIKNLLKNINKEDKTVAEKITKIIPKIEKLTTAIINKMKIGGRLFYIGSGTSGRLGIIDASECPPTFGVKHGRVVGIIAGGDSAIRKAVEFAEDDVNQGWKDLNKYKINTKDVVIGITASGTTPYVVSALKKCKEKKILTACLTCNKKTPLAKYAKFPIEIIVGPEFVTGSTRMKAGTAQKLILNMISTSVMIKLDRVQGNKMVDMQLSNNKLVKRGTNMVMKKLNIDEEKAKKILLKHKSVRKAITKNE